MVTDGDTIDVGNISLKVIHTPGHSPGGISLYTPGFVFTGDTLFVEAVGRTDLPGGSWQIMYKSIQEKLFTLPDDTKVMPGHNYGRTPTSTIGHEKKYNPSINKGENEFMKKGLQKTDFAKLNFISRGKVRDIYSVGNFY